MLTAYLVVSLCINLFMSYVWTTNGFANTAIKVAFSLYSVWTAVLLIGHLAPMVAASGMRLF